MAQMTAALVREQGVTFAVALVKTMFSIHLIKRTKSYGRWRYRLAVRMSFSWVRAIENCVATVETW